MFLVRTLIGAGLLIEGGSVSALSTFSPSRRDLAFL